MMSGDRFVVEADRKVVGLAVRVPGGFKFFSSDPAFRELEATTFPRARAMARRISEVAQTTRLSAVRENKRGEAASHQALSGR
jgi:hypothetical protein